MDTSWRQKRKSTFFIFCLQYFIDGLQHSIGYTTGWIYMKEVAGNSSHLDLYYGIANGSLYLPTLLFSNFVSYVIDGTRDVKGSLIFGNVMSMIGCVFYILPGHVYYLIVGRFFIGYVLMVRPVIIGELARVYEGMELLQKSKILRGSFGLGRAFAPATTLIFINTRFWIGPVHFSYSNLSTVLLFVVTVLITIAMMKLVSNLSKQFDLKEFKMKNQGNKTQKSKEEQKQQQEQNTQLYDKGEVQGELLLNDKNENSFSVINALKKAFTTFDILLCLFVNFVRAILEVLILLTTPAVIIDQLNYSQSTLNAIMLLQTILFIIIMVIFYFCNVNHVDGAITALIGIILSLIAVFIVHRSFTYITNCIILTFAYSMIEISNVNLNIFCALGIAQQVSSRYQSLMDSIRVQVTLLGNLVASLLLPKIIGRNNAGAILLPIIVLFLIILILYRRKAFVYPTIKII